MLRQLVLRIISIRKELLGKKTVIIGKDTLRLHRYPGS